MSDFIIFDTSVLVDELRTGRHRQRIASVDGLVRTSSVVLAELGRGVSGRAERRFLRDLAGIHSILTPTEKNWLESGEILAGIRADHGFAPGKLRDIHFDVLIALTARSHGSPPDHHERQRFRINCHLPRIPRGSLVNNFLCEPL